RGQLFLHYCKFLLTTVLLTIAGFLTAHLPRGFQSRTITLSLHPDRLAVFYVNQPTRADFFDAQIILLLFPVPSFLLLGQYRIAITTHAFSGYNRTLLPTLAVRRICSVHASRM